MYALVELVIKGPEASISLFFVGMPVSLYLLMSVLAAMVSFGLFCSHIVRKLTAESIPAKLLDALEAKLEHNRGRLEQAFTKKFAKLSINEFEVTEDLKTIDKQLKENHKGIERIDETRNKHLKTLERQTVAFKDIKKRIEILESQLTPKPHLTSRSSIQEISGVGPKIAGRLESIGMTRVEDLITEYPRVVALRTKIPQKKIENIQATAQFLMIPGIDEKRAKLLHEAGITSANKLADQNPIQLFKKIANITGNSDDRPTLEEIASYIKLAQHNFSVFY